MYFVPENQYNTNIFELKIKDGKIISENILPQHAQSIQLSSSAITSTSISDYTIHTSGGIEKHPFEGALERTPSDKRLEIVL